MAIADLRPDMLGAHCRGSLKAVPDAAQHRDSINSRAEAENSTQLHLLTDARDDVKELQAQLAAATKRYSMALQ